MSQQVEQSHYQNHNEQYFNNNWRDVSQKLPVKQHIQQIENELDENSNNLNVSRKDLDQLKMEITNLNHSTQENHQTVSKFILDDSQRLLADFRKIQDLELEETNYLKSQVNQLNEDKIKLQQATIILENRVIEAEKELGFL